MRGALSGEFRPMPSFTIALGLRAQWSGDPLFAFEEFSAGNYTAGRGYDPGALLGDSGIGLQAELRYGNVNPAGPTDFAFEPYVFFDQAWVWNEDVLFSMPPPGAEFDRRRRSRRLWRPLPDRPAARRATRPRASAKPARRHAAAPHPDRPLVALEVPMTREAEAVAGLRRRRPLRHGPVRPAGRAGVQRDPEDRCRLRHLRPGDAGRGDRVHR